MKVMIEKVEKGFVVWVLNEEFEKFECENLEEAFEISQKYLGE